MRSSKNKAHNSKYPWFRIKNTQKNLNPGYCRSAFHPFWRNTYIFVIHLCISIRSVVCILSNCDHGYLCWSQKVILCDLKEYQYPFFKIISYL